MGRPASYQPGEAVARVGPNGGLYNADGKPLCHCHHMVMQTKGWDGNTRKYRCRVYHRERNSEWQRRKYATDAEWRFVHQEKCSRDAQLRVIRSLERTADGRD